MVPDVVWAEKPDVWLQPLVNALDEAVQMCHPPTSEDSFERTMIYVSILPRGFVGCEDQHHANHVTHGLSSRSFNLVRCDADRFQPSDTITFRAHPAVQELNSQALLQISQLRDLQRQGKLIWVAFASFVLFALPWFLIQATRSSHISVSDPFAKPKCAEDKELIIPASSHWHLAVLICCQIPIILLYAHFVCRRLFFMALFSFDALVLTFHSLLLHCLAEFSNQNVFIASGNFSAIQCSLACVHRALVVIITVFVSTPDAVILKRSFKVACISGSLIMYSIYYLRLRFLAVGNALTKLEICHWSICQSLDNMVLQTLFTIMFFHAKILCAYAFGHRIVLLHPTWKMHSRVASLNVLANTPLPASEHEHGQLMLAELQYPAQLAIGAVRNTTQEERESDQSDIEIFL